MAASAVSGIPALEGETQEEYYDRLRKLMDEGECLPSLTPGEKIKIPTSSPVYGPLQSLKERRDLVDKMLWYWAREYIREAYPELDEYQFAYQWATHSIVILLDEEKGK